MTLLQEAGSAGVAHKPWTVMTGCVGPTLLSGTLDSLGPAVVGVVTEVGGPCGCLEEFCGPVAAL